ncbi:hypothetical protein [Pseudomonas oryzihabitans]|uniref:hypothetical protein n=1 Tax=Pseudomonas oryzihabitans TaxID=47885 RepID=UPI0011A36883|nr:hypothetical protein [Pseudomonas oryzihabitans]
MNAQVQGLPVFVAIDGEFIQVNPQTGELAHYAPAAVRKHIVKLYQGSDTVFPAQAKSATQLARAVSAHDQWSTQLMYYADRVIDLLDQGVSSEAVRIFKHICPKLEGRNIWFGQLKELGDSLGLPERSVKRAVAELKAANLIRVEKQGRGQPSRVLVHPWYGFRGDRSLQDQYIKDWTK